MPNNKKKEQATSENNRYLRKFIKARDFHVPDAFADIFVCYVSRYLSTEDFLNACLALQSNFRAPRTEIPDSFKENSFFQQLKSAASERYKQMQTKAALISGSHYNNLIAVPNHHFVLGEKLINYKELNIIEEKCFTNHSSPYGALCRTANGQVYAYGSNELGQLGLGDTAYYREKPILITSLADKKVIAIATGSSFALALTETGDVYSWGRNENGELGLEHKLNRTLPTLINSLPEKVIAISAGYGFSLCLTKKGEVYSWGFNKHGELGLGNEENKNKPTLVALPDKITAISTGAFSSFYLTEKGQVYSWGDNRHGQLGLSDNSIHKNIPTLVTALSDKQIISIAANNSYVAFLTKQGEVYTCGTNQYGALGHGNLVNETIPTQIKTLTDIPIAKIIALENRLFLISDAGKIYACGINNYHQISRENIQCYTTPVEVKLDELSLDEEQKNSIAKKR